MKLTFIEWLSRRPTLTNFEKWLIRIAQENQLKSYRDFIFFFNHIHRQRVYCRLPYENAVEMFNRNCVAKFQKIHSEYESLFEM